MPPERRQVVLDADVNWKLAHEIRKRGRENATALKLERIDDLKDGALLKTLAAGFEPCVLVTWDNRMRHAHAAEIRHFGSTVAVINRTGLDLWAGSEETYVRNAVHRWLHRIEVQEAGTTTLYTTDTISRVLTL